MFPLSISIDYFIPILHQDQLLKTIEKCGEFNQPCQIPGARKRSSANHYDSGEDSKQNLDWVDEIEYETHYPKLMLEQRMNNKIHFRELSQ